MQQNFTPSLARDLVYEGGYSNNKADPGGPTNKGVTQATYSSWLRRTSRASASVAGISDADVAAIYKTDYWDRILGDELPSGIDFCIFDAAVNSGVATAISWAQAVLKTYPDTPLSFSIDGDLGPATKRALLAADVDQFIHDFCSHRLGTLQRLKTWKTFGKGWSARIANVQKTAVAWAQSDDSSTGPEPVQVAVHGGQQKARIEQVPNNRFASLTTHVGSMATAAGAAIASLAGALQPASGTFPWVATVLGVLTVLGAVIGVVLMVSQKANDAAANNIAKATVDADADAQLPQVPIGKTPLEKASTPPTPGPAAVSTAPAQPPEADAVVVHR